VAANVFPLGSGMVTAYAKKELGDEIDVEIFKYPNDLADYLDKGMPQIACFSSFSWNIRLHHEYARRIKAANPAAITVFGGCNFPDEAESQHEFLTKFTAIDFYVEYEGEVAFVELIKNLKAVDFDAARFKRERRHSPNLRYLVDGELIASELGPRIKDLNVIPSPYVTGLFDKFYDGVLIPLIQTTRGCPYECTFCWEGSKFFQKVNRFSQEHIRAELDYIAPRVGKVPDLQISDANFGIFKDDLDTARAVLEVREKYTNLWPKSITTQTSKNNKERTIEIVELLGDIMPATGAVQSTDPKVLEVIKRKNPSMGQLEALGKVTDSYGGQTEGEIVLCLPGDNRAAHFKTVADLLDVGMTFIRIYQYMLLPGSEAARNSSRREHEMLRRFRVLPRCFGYYRFGEERFGVAEIEEIVVANKTMSYDDYQACRDLSLTVEVFNNDWIFSDLTHFLQQFDVRRSEFITRCYELIAAGDGPISKLYTDCRAEEKKNLWTELEPVEAFVEKPGVIDRYISGEYGTNELYKYRALAVFENIEALHEVAFAAGRSLIAGKNALNPRVEKYLTELERFSLMRKRKPLNMDEPQKGKFHFDFVRLLDKKFMMDPFDVESPEPISILVDHTDRQRNLIEGYVKQYGTTLIGLGRILIRANMGRLYRSAMALDQHGQIASTSMLPTRESLGRFGGIGSTVSK
jgi:radical SAM superfamily enzyme YgiQ (UPF0313 family)